MWSYFEGDESMKKLSAGLVGAALMVAGLVGVPSGAASADPYPGTIPTFCSASAMNEPRGQEDAKVRFKAGTDGNGKPKGLVTFKYYKNDQLKRTFKVWYAGGKREYTLGSLPKRGLYQVVTSFDSKPRNSAYTNCSTSFEQRKRGQSR